MPVSGGARSDAATIVQTIAPAPRDIWQRIATDDRSALLEHTPAWVDAIVAAGNFRDASRMYRLADGRHFVLPLVQRGPRRGPQRSFGSGWGIGGLVGRHLDAGVISAVNADLARDPALFTHVRPNPIHGELWAAAETHGAIRVPRRAHVVDLSGGTKATWTRLRKSGRRDVTKARNAGVEVSVHCGGDRLDEYYQQLYLPSVGRWARRQNEPLPLARIRAKRRDPLRKLQQLAASLGDTFRLYLATVDGVPAAGNIVLFGPHNAHATRGAMDYELARTTRAGYLADWAAIRDAADAGFDWYHLGESGHNESLAEYKERFGALAVDYSEYRFERVPLLQLDAAVRTRVKRLINFRDT